MYESSAPLSNEMVWVHTLSTHDRVRGLGRDAARALSSGPTLNEDVALGTPRRTPTVLHFPVVGAVHGAVPNDQNAVVELGSAPGTSEDAAGVELEDGLVGLDRHRDWLLGNGSLQRVLVAGSDIFVAGHRLERGAARPAGSVAGGVGVRRLAADAVFDDVLEGAVHEPTVAPGVAVSSGAIDELLLTVGVEVAVLDVVGRFESTRGRERPA
mmetsp:Transcript_28917/g.56275  ORF Transcript_28917/g.56275 Transcript_28917/m.56275 type:complete len:212 (-) Transcript_28917:442-1077(-)